jgi:hypothetical protein
MLLDAMRILPCGRWAGDGGPAKALSPARLLRVSIASPYAEPSPRLAFPDAHKRTPLPCTGDGPPVLARAVSTGRLGEDYYWSACARLRGACYMGEPRGVKLISRTIGNR